MHSNWLPPNARRIRVVTVSDMQGYSTSGADFQHTAATRTDIRAGRYAEILIDDFPSSHPKCAEDLWWKTEERRYETWWELVLKDEQGLNESV